MTSLLLLPECDDCLSLTRWRGLYSRLRYNGDVPGNAIKTNQLYSWGDKLLNLQVDLLHYHNYQTCQQMYRQIEKPANIHINIQLINECRILLEYDDSLYQWRKWNPLNQLWCPMDSWIFHQPFLVFRKLSRNDLKIIN